MNSTSDSFIILYGSQTGRAAAVAERVAREGTRRGFHVTLSPMNTFDFEGNAGVSLVACFIASTTGQGQEPDNMRLFWNFLCRKSLPADFLVKLKFTVLGLGDSSYAKYNVVGKKLHKRLLQLGGTPLTKIFLADDQHELGPDAVIDEWLQELWERIQPGTMPNPESTLPPKLLMTNEEPPTGFSSHSVRSVWMGKLMKNDRVTTEDHFQDVRLISIDLNGSGLQYEPGDVLRIQPSNSADNIQKFFQLFPHLEERRTTEEFYLSPNWSWVSMPPQLLSIHSLPWNWDFVVRNYFDLQSVPSRLFFEVLSQFSTNELELKKLLEFGSREGQVEMDSYCRRSKRSVLEVLQDFQHTTANIPVPYLFDLIPPIQARSFSLASSMAAHENEAQILVAIVKYLTKLKKPRLGLCSNWLGLLCPGSGIPLWIERGSFRFPAKHRNQSVIMVGPGTGCAPFRSFISQEEKSKCENGKNLILFFGCRYKEKDFYFQTEWEAAEARGRLRLFTAFSRQDAEGSRAYVQNRIVEEGELLWNLLSSGNSSVFLAGNAKGMPMDVWNAFISICREKGSPDPEGFMKSLVKRGKYQTEIWS